MSAILERQQAGVKVRIIFRLFMKSVARENMEALQDFGFDMSQVRVQKNCHTKGIIVDRERVLIGSHNLSNQGVSINRDASLIFEDKPLARYFAEVFEHDWEFLADQDIGREIQSIEFAAPGTATPVGKMRVTWKDFLEMA